MRTRGKRGQWSSHKATIRLFFIELLYVFEQLNVFPRLPKLFDLKSLANQPLGQELCLESVI